MSNFLNVLSKKQPFDAQAALISTEISSIKLDM